MSLSLCSSVLSFNAPVVMRPAQRASVHMAASDMVGVSVETGGKVWDPLKLSEKMDEGNLKLMRAAELKHGRVAMLANVGWAWTATGTHFEGMISSSQKLSFAEIAAASDPIAAAAKVPAAGIWQMIFAIGALEVFWENKYPAAELAGNFGVPAVTTDPEKLYQLELMELKNGRLAMIGIMSYACAVSIPGSVPFYPF
ncbi:hypothetical protein AB1Y20_023209 [Prymnesium parvum]|uniref:Chloroplast light harvesting protein n=1 Tax=Prymnesium parvum TaxID=97485 RepID=A0AB34JGA7_PRYPA|mmetsp:Transcript_35522/g.86327  ORF Transcript_35522/g.86327 Transcript_35522/m.86327 type:complete len:198 (-) Transcript_35522:225-818(-)